MLTCYHIIRDLEKRAAEAGMKVEIAGRVGGRRRPKSYPLEALPDKENDLCVLRLPQNPTGWPNVQDIGEPCVTDEIISLGFPPGRELLYQQGAISGDDAPDGLLTTDTRLFNGMSGGPVFNNTRSVVAIVAGGHPNMPGIDELIPISFATNLLNRYASRDLIKRIEQLERARESPNPVSFSRPLATPTEAKLYQKKADQGYASRSG